jgi:hypothetical protein
MKGMTGIAVESFGSEDFRKPVHLLQSPEFGEVSFWGRLHKLRKATLKEEVRFLRLIMDMDERLEHIEADYLRPPERGSW